MPATSKAQRRLMAMALAYKRHEKKLSEFPAGVRDEIRKIARSMTIKQLEDFAKTKEKGLPKRKRRKKR